MRKTRTTGDGRSTKIKILIVNSKFQSCIEFFSDDTIVKFFFRSTLIVIKLQFWNYIFFGSNFNDGFLSNPLFLAACRVTKTRHNVILTRSPRLFYFQHELLHAWQTWSRLGIFKVWSELHQFQNPICTNYYVLFDIKFKHTHTHKSNGNLKLILFFTRTEQRFDFQKNYISNLMLCLTN